MNKRKIHITRQDMDRLRDLLRTAADPFGMNRPYLQGLSTELDRATIVAPEEIDSDVVTMNSTVRVRDRENRHDTTLRLVFPQSANLQEDCISVMSPLGAAILGYRAGDRFSFETPAGTRTCEILEVLYQPEAAGDLHL